MSGTFLRNSPRRGGQLASSGTVFQRVVNSLHEIVIHPLVDMRGQGVGELTDNDTYWHLAYDDCSHVQAFAREGLDDPEGATFFVRPHYAQCLACALVNKPVAAGTPSVKPAQFHLVLSLDELGAIATALRSSAERLDNVLRQLRRAP